MKTEETMEKTVLQKVSEKLLEAHREIDELALQLSLGKAEGKDKFEEIKKEFRAEVTRLKDLLSNASDNVLSPEVRSRIEALELQLALGRAESRERFDEQKNKIISALHSLETEIKDQWHRIQAPHQFAHQVEKFKLKLEILRLRFGLKKFEVKEDYHSRMATAKSEINSLTSGARDQLSKGKEKYDDFRDEVSLAYKHLKKAVESLS